LHKEVDERSLFTKRSSFSPIQCDNSALSRTSSHSPKPRSLTWHPSFSQSTIYPLSPSLFQHVHQRFQSSPRRRLRIRSNLFRYSIPRRKEEQEDPQGDQNRDLPSPPPILCRSSDLHLLRYPRTRQGRSSGQLILQDFGRCDLVLRYYERD